MKICDIAQFYSPLSGGVKRYLHDKQRFLARRPDGHHVLIVPSHRDAVESSERATVYEIRSPRLIGSRSYRLLLARRRILEIAARERPDLIEVGDPYRTAWIGLEAGAALGVPVVAFYHSDFPRAFGRTVHRFAGERAERFVSGPVHRYLRRLYNRMSATVVTSRRLCLELEACGFERTVHVPLGTDAAVFRPMPGRGALRAELGIAAGERMLLFVGRMAREKNIRNLVGALDHLPEGCPPCRLVLVGDGELHDFVEREAARRPNLVWQPHCDSPGALASLYGAADLFVHPGKCETFGLVALEAQACGTPVLVVREGGVDEAVAGEDPPLAAVDGSSRGLAEAIGRIVRSPETGETRSARRRRIEQRFSIETTFDRLFALYAHLVAGRPPAAFPSESALDHEHPRSPLPTR